MKKYNLDSNELVENFGVVFDHKGLDVLIGGVLEETLALDTKRRADVDFLDHLNRFGPIALYNGNVLAGSWFANKLAGPFYKNVYL